MILVGSNYDCVLHWLTVLDFITKPYLFSSEETKIPDGVVELKRWNELMTAIAAVQHRRMVEARDREELSLSEQFNNLGICW